MVCDLIGSNYAVRATGKTRSRKNKKAPNEWFFQMGKQKSHALILQILEILGYHDTSDRGCDSDSSDAMLYRIFSKIPDRVIRDTSQSELNRVQALALLSKNDDVNFGIDKEAVAWAKFQDSERSCRIVNDMLSKGVDSELSSILFYAQGFIADVLGPCPALEDLDFSFGKGATLGCSSNKTTPLWKLSPNVTLTSSMIPLVEDLRRCMPGWLASPDTRFIFGTGRLEFVAKSWKTKRSVIITGTLNALVQRAYGVKMKRRLMLAGINLSTGQSKHKALAREASVLDNWSTVDLSAASDSIAWRLVMDLLPWEWFVALDAVRDREVTYKGEVICLEKFSSMGCGYTFELETLIFWALIYGICRLKRKPFEASVYGDDIIVRPEIGLYIEHYFPLFGFALNREKTFLTGAFKESCGGDYVNGIDVRPFFLRSLRFNGRFTYHGLCSLHNFMVRKPWFDPEGKIRALAKSNIPENLHLFGPDGYGDGHLIDDSMDLVEYQLKNKHGIDPYFTFKTHIAVPFRETEEAPSDPFLVRIYGASRRPEGQASDPIDWYVTRLPAMKRMRAKTTRIRVTQREYTSRFGLS